MAVTRPKVSLNGDEKQKLEELSDRNDFWQSIYDYYAMNGGLTKRQHLKLVEEMEK